MKNKPIKQGTIEARAESFFEPSFYQVCVHDDDFTPREFVAASLERFFYMERYKAVEVMMEVRQKGIAACGSYSKDVADSIISKAEKYAREKEYPLLYSMEAI